MDRRLGGPLPHQLPNPTRADPSPINLSPKGRMRYYPQFPRTIPQKRARSHALLTRLPLPLRGVRLACVKPAASVRSEPGSNSQVENSISTKSRHSESTRTHTHHLPHRCDNNEVYSLVQNVTVKVYSRDPNSFRPRKLRRPRFSFFSYSIVKKQTAQNSHKIKSQKLQAPGNKQAFSSSS